MNINKEHTAGEASDGISKAILRLFLLFFCLAPGEQGLNVSVDDGSQA